MKYNRIKDAVDCVMIDYLEGVISKEDAIMNFTIALDQMDRLLDEEEE